MKNLKKDKKIIDSQTVACLKFLLMGTTNKTKFATVEEYFAAQPPHVRVLLKEMRATILKAAPGADEVMSYSMPAVKLHGMLVWYAAFKEHIGFLPKTIRY